MTTALPPARGRFRRGLLVGASAIIGALTFALVAPTGALAATVTSAGPLTNITVSPTLNCALNYRGDSSGAFYGGSGCGTFLAYTDGASMRLAAPASVPAAGTFESAFVPVSQTSIGAGTRDNPYTISTVVKAVGASGADRMRVEQTDTYVIGDNAYRTTTTVSSLDGAAHDAIVYAAADCYLGDNDRGLGDYDSVSGAITCKKDASANSRIEQFIPLTSGSSYFYGGFSQNWSNVKAKTPLSNTLVTPNTSIDNAMSLSWSVKVPATGSQSVTRLTNFSPTNLRPLPTTITASPSSLVAGDATTLTVSMSNADNTTDVQALSLSLTLPAGATLVAGSSTGTTSAATQSGTTVSLPLSKRLAAGASTAATVTVVFPNAGQHPVSVSGAAELAPVLPSTVQVKVAEPLPAPPIAGDDVASTAFNTPLTGLNVRANDSGTGIRVTSVGTTDKGTVTLNADGTLSFTPKQDFFGSTTFSYTITDVAGQTATGTVKVSVAAPGAPVATDDSVTTPFNTTAAGIAVLANDSGTGLRVTAVGTSDKGTVTLNADGTVSFAPKLNVHGDASFTYTITDVAGQTATGTVRVTISLPAAPVAGNDAVVTAFNTGVSNLNVLANDSGAGIHVTAVGATEDGTATLNANGTVSFAPKQNFFGATSFSYTITDVAGQTATGTVTVTVNLPAAPIAANDAIVTAFNTAATNVDVLANDAGVGLRLTAVGTSAEGTVTLNADGTVSFAPKHDFFGQTSFSYTVTDIAGQTATGTVAVTVNLPTAPIAANDAVMTPFNTPATGLDVLANDAGTGIRVTAVGASDKGTAALNADATVSFAPNRNVHGDATFSYTITDLAGRTATGTVTVTVGVPAGPSAVDDNATTPFNTAVDSLDVLSNDQGTEITVTAVGTTSDGTAKRNADGTIAFTPKKNFFGDASFSYTITDAAGQTAKGTVTITVARPAAPVAANDAFVTPFNTAAERLDVLANDEGTGIRVTAVGASEQGTATLDADGTITFAPNVNHFGDATFEYTITDVTGQTAVGTVTVAVAFPASPIIANIHVTTPFNTAVESIPLLDDAEGTQLTATAVGQSNEGTATLTGDATASFMPRENFVGDAVFEYTVTDLAAQTVTGLVTVTVAPPGAPVAGDHSVTTAFETAVEGFDVVSLDSGTGIRVTALGTTPDGVAMLTDTGAITFTPNTGFSGVTTFTYTITDAAGQVANGTLTVTVGAAPEAVVLAKTGSTVESGLILLIAALTVLGGALLTAGSRPRRNVARP